MEEKYIISSTLNNYFSPIEITVVDEIVTLVVDTNLELNIENHWLIGRNIHFVKRYYSINTNTEWTLKQTLNQKHEKEKIER